MSLNETVSSERIHIGFFGKRNAGKSSLVNAVTGQELAVVSDVKGTTTDPVKKAMELLPLGPVVVIDTPGIDDEGSLGELRVRKTRLILAKTDIAVLVVDSGVGLTNADNELIELFKERNIPYIVAYNKSDLLNEKFPSKDNEIFVSATDRINIYELKEKIGDFAKKAPNDKKIISDLVEAGDLIVLVIPVDESAPKGRIILPQQQVLREALDLHCSVVCCQDTELKQTLQGLSAKPRLVITDSQVFKCVSADTPQDITLTSFSILFARYKGDLTELVKGASVLKNLKEGDNVLISEGCTHHRQCNDIGSVKMPNWLENFSGARLNFDFTSGGDFPENLSKYKVVVHCGGCMLNAKEMQHRINICKANGTPIVNYGVAIAHMNGILERSLAPFPDIQKILD